MTKSMRKRLRKRRQKRSLRKQLFGGIGEEGSTSVTPTTNRPQLSFLSGLKAKQDEIKKEDLKKQIEQMNEKLLSENPNATPITMENVYTETPNHFSSYPTTSSNAIHGTIHSLNSKRIGQPMITTKKGGRRTQKKRR